MSVYALRYSKFYSSVFLSCSADWTVQLWHDDTSTPVLSFDLGSPVNDIHWHPHSSSIFACVSSDGRAIFYDLNESKYEATCEQYVTKKSHLSRLRFHPSDPILLTGDERGVVTSFKQSPNLRKLCPPGSHETQEEKLMRLVLTSMGRSLDAIK
jgi:dynein intermediate chain 1